MRDTIRSKFDVKFPGLDSKEKANSEVKSYYLTPEEHAKYLNPEAVKVIQAKRMIREKPWLTLSTIVEETGLDLAKVKQIVYYERQIDNKKRNRTFN